MGLITKGCNLLLEKCGESMCRSKSLGNFFTIRDVLQQFHPMALRWFLIGTQYRQPVNYTLPALQEATNRLYYICETLHNAAQVVQGQGENCCTMHEKLHSHWDRESWSCKLFTASCQ